MPCALAHCNTRNWLWGRVWKGLEVSGRVWNTDVCLLQAKPFQTDCPCVCFTLCCADSETQSCEGRAISLVHWAELRPLLPGGNGGPRLSRVSLKDTGSVRTEMGNPLLPQLVSLYPLQTPRVTQQGEIARVHAYMSVCVLCVCV